MGVNIQQNNYQSPQIQDQMNMQNMVNSFQNPSVKEAASVKHADMEGSAPLYVSQEMPS